MTTVPQHGLAAAEAASGARYRGALAISVTLAGRELSSRLVSLWPYLVASGMMLIAAFAARSFMASFGTETVAVDAAPLRFVHVAVIVFLALSLGTAAATSLAWEREHRTLDVLLAGPVTAGVLVVAKLATEMATLATLLLSYVLYLAVAQPLASASPGLMATASMWRDAVLALPLIAFGLLVSSLAATVRQAVLVFLVVLVALAAIAIGRLWLAVQDPNDLSLAALALRRGLDVVDQPLAWLSPVGYLVELVKQGVGESVPSASRTLAAVVAAAAAIIGAVVITWRRGAL